MIKLSVDSIFARVVLSVFFVSLALVPLASDKATAAAQNTYIGGGAYTDMVTGFDNFGRIVYYSGSSIIYVRCTNVVCDSGNRNVTTIDATIDNFITSPVIQLGSDGLSRILYYDRDNNELMFTRCLNDDCTSRSTSTDVYTGTTTIYGVSMTLENDLARIVISKGSVGFVRCDDLDCSSYGYDSSIASGTVINNTSIVIGNDGYPRIAYAAGGGSSSVSWLARCTDTLCNATVLTRIDAATGVGVASIAVGHDGFLRLTYPAGESTVRYARCVDDNCTAASNVTSDFVGLFKNFRSMTLDSYGHAVIAYVYGDLKFARCEDDNCSTQTHTIASTSLGILYDPVISLDLFGHVRMSYYTSTPNDVMYYTETDVLDYDDPWCSSISVVNCGVYSPAEFLTKLNNGDGLNSAANLQQIFLTELGYTQTGIAQMVDAVVYANGDVKVNDVLVATGARSMSRIDYGNPNYQKYPTPSSTLYRTTDAGLAPGVPSITALVLMVDGQFVNGVMKPCGNPFTADPEPAPEPTPTASVSPTPSNAPISFPECCKGAMQERKAVMGSSVVDAHTTVDFSWKTQTTATVKGIRIKVCTTADPYADCNAPVGASLSGSSLVSTGGEYTGTWAYAIVSNNEVLLTNSTGVVTVKGGADSISIAGFRNPTTYGTYYFRASTYATTAAEDEDTLDCADIAVSTAKSLTQTADVGENLVFRVANTVNDGCTGQYDIEDPNDSTEDLVTLVSSPMSLMTASVGTAQFCAMTNAANGYVITYADELGYDGHYGFWNGSHQFNPGGITLFSSTPGTEQFGFNVTPDLTTAALTADLTNANYSTSGQYSYDDSGLPVPLAIKTAPTMPARYTLNYLANISQLTPGGTYQAHQIFVITATF